MTLKQLTLPKLTSCRQAAATICPRPSGGAEAPRAAEPTAAPADGKVEVGSHRTTVNTFHTHHCSCLMCKAAVGKAAW